MQVNRVEGTPSATTRSAQDRKLRRAAQEFEGELLSCLLGPMERAFSGLSDLGSAGSDQYGYLGIQALAAALARTGGIGVGELVLAQIQGTKVGGGERPFSGVGVHVSL